METSHPSSTAKPSVVSLVIERNGTVLLARRSRDKDHAPGEWESISGRVEPGESLIEAAHREALEETGLLIDVVEEIGRFIFDRGVTKTPTCGITFHCRAREGEERVSSEHDEFVWITLDKAENYNLPDGLVQCIYTVLGRREQHDA